MFSKHLRKEHEEIHQRFKRADVLQRRGEDKKQGEEEDAPNDTPVLTEDVFKKWVDQTERNGITPTLAQAKRRFDGFANANAKNIKALFTKLVKTDLELEEILDQGPGSAMRTKLAERLYNPINTFKRPNEVHEADLLFLPHDEEDLAEIERSKRIDIEDFVSGGALGEEAGELEHLPAHRRIYGGAGGQNKQPRQQRLRANPKQTKRFGNIVHEPTHKDRPYRYCLTVVDVASRFKGAYPLRSKESRDVYDGLWEIYNNSPLSWPAILRTDSGTEFKGLQKILMNPKTKISTSVQFEIPFYHLPFVENFNQKLTEKIFKSQREQELAHGETVKSWVTMLPEFLNDFNKIPQESLGRKTPSEAMALPKVQQKPDGPPNQTNPLFHDWEQYTKKKFKVGDIVRHYIPKDQYQQTDNDRKIIRDKGRRAGDPKWSVRKFRVIRVWRPKPKVCDENGENCKPNNKQLWMHNIWPVEKKLPENKAEWAPQNLAQSDHSVHYGYTRAFTYFQLRATKTKPKKEIPAKDIVGTNSAHSPDILEMARTGKLPKAVVESDNLPDEIKKIVKPSFSAPKRKVMPKRVAKASRKQKVADSGGPRDKKRQRKK